MYENYYNEFVKRENFNAKTILFDRRTAKRKILLRYLHGDEKIRVDSDHTSDNVSAEAAIVLHTSDTSRSATPHDDTVT